MKKTLLLIPTALFILGCNQSTEDISTTTTTTNPETITNINEEILDEVINGYTLPPEPDKTLNNSTLLGIDLNNNGVRDDVERKIVIKYQNPLEVTFVMEYAKEHQSMLNSPLSEAVEIEGKMSKIADCSLFLNRKNIKLEKFIEYTENYTYNTKERVIAYIQFNKALSGGSYGSAPSTWNIHACSDKVKKIFENK